MPDSASGVSSAGHKYKRGEERLESPQEPAAGPGSPEGKPHPGGIKHSPASPQQRGLSRWTQRWCGHSSSDGRRAGPHHLRRL